MDTFRTSHVRPVRWVDGANLTRSFSLESEESPPAGRKAE